MLGSGPTPTPLYKMSFMVSRGLIGILLSESPEIDSGFDCREAGVTLACSYWSIIFSSSSALMLGFS